MTKDETFIQNSDPKIIKKYFNLSLLKKNKVLSSREEGTYNLNATTTIYMVLTREGKNNFLITTF